MIIKQKQKKIIVLLVSVEVKKPHMIWPDWQGAK